MPVVHHDFGWLIGHGSGVGGLLAGGAAAAAAAYGAHHLAHGGFHHYGHGKFKHGKFKHGKFGKRSKHGMFGRHKGKSFGRWKWFLSPASSQVLDLFFTLHVLVS